MDTVAERNMERRNMIHTNSGANDFEVTGGIWRAASDADHWARKEAAVHPDSDVV